MPLVKKAYYMQNDGHLSLDPPKHLGNLAGRCWRKIIPFLESTKRVERIDSGLIEMYCSQYEIYRNAYDSVKKDGSQTAIYKSIQNAAGEVIKEDFAGFRKNPAVNIMKDATTLMISLGSELGLSPKSRAELMQIVDQNEDDEASMQALLEGGGDDEF